MATVKTMSAKGDNTEAEWDPEKVKAGDPEAVKMAEYARTIIQSNQGLGNAVVVTIPGTDAEHKKLETFDPTQEQEVVILPRMVGGSH